MILDRPPEFCLKPVIYRYLFKTGHAPGAPCGAIFVPRAYSEQIEIWFTGWCYILNIRALDLVVSNKMILLCLQYANVISVNSMMRLF